MIGNFSVQQSQENHGFTNSIGKDRTFLLPVVLPHYLPHLHKIGIYQTTSCNSDDRELDTLHRLIIECPLYDRQKRRYEKQA